MCQMKQINKKSLLGAAVAGIVSASILVAPSFAGDKKGHKHSKDGKGETEKCYGVNKCSGHGKCGGVGTSCAGTNKCAGQGWLELPKGLCLELQNGSLTPIEKK